MGTWSLRERYRKKKSKVPETKMGLEGLLKCRKELRGRFGLRSSFLFFGPFLPAYGVESLGFCVGPEPFDFQKLQVELLGLRIASR